MSDGVKFIRVNGRVVPIRSGAPGSNKAPKGYAKRAGKEPKVRKGLRLMSNVSAVASGVISGATLFSGVKLFAAGQALGLGLDLGSTAFNAGAHVGKDRKAKRLKGLAKTELTNNVIGYGAMAATILSQKKGREKIVEYSAKAVNGLKKLALKVAL